VSKGENRTPEYLTLSPSGKVPAYVEGDFVLTESGAIINYLLQKFGKFDEFAPRDIQQRAKYESWLLFTVGHLDPTLVPALNHIHHTPRDLQDTVMLAHKKKEFDEICIPAIESALRANDNLFVCGTSFTAADIVVMYSLRMAVRQGKLEVHPIFACLTYDQAESFGLA
jgi:glutathione S-transferase